MIVYIAVLAAFALVVPCGLAIWLINRMPHIRAWKVALISAATEPALFMLAVMAAFFKTLSSAVNNWGFVIHLMDLAYFLMAIGVILAFFALSTLVNWLVIHRMRTRFSPERDDFE